MQLRMNDVHVDETPKFLARDPNELTHAVAVRGNHRDSEVLTIHLSLKGVTSYFPTRKPTQAEYEAAEDVFHLTYQSPQWDPADPYYCNLEDSMLDHQGVVRERPGQTPSFGSWHMYPRTNDVLSRRRCCPASV